MRRTCSSCKKKFSTLSYTSGKWLCSRCTKKIKISVTHLTRTSTQSSCKQRLQRQREHHAKDLIQPFEGNKTNEDFAKAYPDKAPDHYSQKELNRMGMPKMKSRKT